VTEDILGRVERLEAEVRRLSDLEEIRRLRMRYHELNNERRAHEVPDLFTEDGEIDFGFMGSGNLSHFARSSERTELIKQMIHNHQVDVDGDAAVGSSYQEAMAVFHGRAFIIAGRYDDEYRRTPEGWRFRRVAFDPYIMMPAERSWARAEDRRVDPHAGVIDRDAEGNLIMPPADDGSPMEAGS
jgi:hypothetical protein